jgi:hypothetical protein
MLSAPLSTSHQSAETSSKTTPATQTNPIKEKASTMSSPSSSVTPSSSNNHDNKMQYHISVTGLQLQSLWKFPSFVKFARRSMIQAHSAPGMVMAKGDYRNGIHHTLSVWRDTASMQAYMRSGAHKEAMAQSKAVGSMVKVYGYNSDTIPTMEEALQLWHDHGRVVFQMARPNDMQKSPPSCGFLSSLLCMGLVVVLFALYTHQSPDLEMLDS